jgi:hypothetical protein
MQKLEFDDRSGSNRSFHQEPFISGGAYFCPNGNRACAPHRSGPVFAAALHAA